MIVLYRTRSSPAPRITCGKAVWWWTGEVARVFKDRHDGGIGVALYERERGTELTIPRRAWFDLDGNHVIDEAPQA